jgi:hypothetical protein
VTLTAQKRHDPTIDFGCVTPCTGAIGDFVWHDRDRDGLQGIGETGLADVTVYLLDQNGQPFNPMVTTTTNGQGGYHCPGVCPGTYTVAVDESTLPNGTTWTPTAAFVGTDPGTEGSDPDDSNSNPFLVTLAEGEENTTIDFGYFTNCAGAIGNFVWYDVDGDGLQGLNEPGIPGVKVTAYRAGLAAGSSVTDGSGFYLVRQLCAGTYQMVVSQVPPQYSGETARFAPTQNPNTVQNPTTDNNGSGYIVTLLSDVPGDPASTDLTIDFGYLAACTGKIGDFVWLDTNQDGVQDPGETGLVGALVIVKDDETEEVVMSKKKEENLLQEIKKKLKIKEEEVNELKVGMRGDGGGEGGERYARQMIDTGFGERSRGGRMLIPPANSSSTSTRNDRAIAKALMQLQQQQQEEQQEE